MASQPRIADERPGDTAQPAPLAPESASGGLAPPALASSTEGAAPLDPLDPAPLPEPDPPEPPEDEPLEALPDAPELDEPVLEPATPELDEPVLEPTPPLEPLKELDASELAPPELEPRDPELNPLDPPLELDPGSEHAAKETVVLPLPLLLLLPVYTVQTPPPSHGLPSSSGGQDGPTPPELDAPASTGAAQVCSPYDVTLPLPPPPLLLPPAVHTPPSPQALPTSAGRQ